MPKWTTGKTELQIQSLPKSECHVQIPDWHSLSTHTAVTKPKSAVIFLGLRSPGTCTVPVRASPTVPALPSAPHPHYLSWAALHPDVANSAIAAREHDPGLRDEFCLRILHQLLTLPSTSAFSPSLCWMENLSPSGCMLAPSTILPLLPQFSWNGKALL